MATTDVGLGRTAADALAAGLAEQGIDTAFGLLGSGNFIVTQALADAGVQVIGARHEGPGLAMADGYARASGRVGVVSVHTGPGLTNTMTALGEAAKSRTPLLVLAGDVPAAALGNNFRIDQNALVRSVGAVADRIYTPESAVADAVRALRRAEVERRPVVLMLPTDVQERDVDRDALKPVPPAIPIERPAPSRAGIEAACDLLEGAQRPVIIAGRGAVLAGAREEIIALGDRLGALLATTAVANGLFTGEPWSVGISGGFSTDLAVELIADADVVLALGAALNYWTTRHGTLIGHDARVVHVELDEESIGFHQHVTLGVVGDVRSAARGLDAELERRGAGSVGTAYRTPEIGEAIRTRGRWNQVRHDDAANGTTIDPRTLSVEVDRLLPADRAVAIDSGHFLGFPAMYLHTQDARSFVFPNAFQAVGLGLGAAIGTAVARPDRPTVAALGDGGALMALGEFETVARLGLPIAVLVYNDAAAGAEVHHFGPLGYDLGLVQFPDVDFAAIARGAGMEAITVRTPEDLDPLDAWSRAPSAPILIDAKVDPTVKAHWLEEAFKGDAH